MKGSPGASESKGSTFSHRKTAGGSSGVPASPPPGSQEGAEEAAGRWGRVHANTRSCTQIAHAFVTLVSWEPRRFWRILSLGKLPNPNRGPRREPETQQVQVISGPCFWSLPHPADIGTNIWKPRSRPRRHHQPGWKCDGYISFSHTHSP